MKKINFLFGIHCHQPLGNFESVFIEAYEKAYLPFIELLEVHPKIKTTVHYSGVLYDWFLKKRPEFIEKLKVLVRRGQVEIMTGGYYEPIIPIIPDSDKIGQIKMESDFIKRTFGQEPVGMWLTERIWEPHLPKVLAEAGVKYITVDDFHFISAGVSPEELFGYYITEEEGYTVAVFPISKTLRYLIPFKLPEETIKYLEKVSHEAPRPACQSGAAGRAAVLADDGEKFGVWPGTHKWVYEDGYLSNLFKLLEENDWIEMMTFSEYINSYPPLGRVYLPTASYFEMMEWALPITAGRKFENIAKEIKESGKFEEYKQFFKGGFFRNFFVKYPEANNMHKKMLYISKKVNDIKNMQTFGSDRKREEKIAEATRELWKGQCNCAYWHGVFGGLYLNYLRNAVYEHLLLSEGTLDKLIHGEGNFIDLTITDFTKSGQNDILLSNNLLNVYISPTYGGSIFEIDYKPKNFNITNTLSRREEVYHRILKETPPERFEVVEKHGTPSIHELVRVKEKGLEKHLKYDWYRRLSLMDHFLDSSTSLENFMASEYKEIGNFIGESYKFNAEKRGKEAKIVLSRDGSVYFQGEGAPIRVIKTILTYAGQSIININYEILNNSNKNLALWFGVEFNFGFLGGYSGDRYYVVEGQKLEEKNLASTGIVTGKAIKIVDEWQGIVVLLDISEAQEIWRFPIETVSQSEGGFERTYQGSVLFPNIKFNIRPEEIKKFKIVISIEE